MTIVLSAQEQNAFFGNLYFDSRINVRQYLCQHSLRDDWNLGSDCLMLAQFDAAQVSVFYL